MLSFWCTRCSPFFSVMCWRWVMDWSPNSKWVGFYVKTLKSNGYLVSPGSVREPLPAIHSKDRKVNREYTVFSELFWNKWRCSVWFKHGITGEMEMSPSSKCPLSFFPQKILYLWAPPTIFIVFCLVCSDGTCPVWAVPCKAEVLLHHLLLTQPLPECLQESLPALGSLPAPSLPFP